jgi:maltose alpha-D-glucosyltransferase/alpha-amylase
MQWSADRNAGFSRTHPHQLYLPLIADPEYHHETVHVEAQQHNRSSLLWFMKHLNALRKRHRAFGRGSIELLRPENHHILAFIRCHEDERILVVANLSRFAQAVELELGEFRDMVPVELFGQIPFWPIGEEPYRLTLGPHALHWFLLQPRSPAPLRRPAAAQAALPEIATSGAWDDAVFGEARQELEALLPEYLQAQRWFGGKARRILGVRLADAVAVPYRSTRGFLAQIWVDYTAGDPEGYALPLACVPADRAGEYPDRARIARVCQTGRGRVAEGILIDALYDIDFSEALLNTGARRLKGIAGEVVARYTPTFRQTKHRSKTAPGCVITYVERSNTTVIHGERLALKLYRRLDTGVHPEAEIGAFLARSGFAHAPPLAGSFTYRRQRAEPVPLAIVHRFVPAESDAWEQSLAALAGYLERALAAPGRPPDGPAGARTLLELADGDAPDLAQELIGPYLRSAGLLGARTAELHRALASATEDPSFVPEPFNLFYQRSRYQAMRGLTGTVLDTLRRRLGDLPRSTRGPARRLVALEDGVLARLRWMLDGTIPGCRIRCHGNYHLQQVLCNGDEYTIVDFEGEPRRPLAERRLKRSPLHDVAGMLRSFDYAARRGLADREAGSARGGGHAEAERLLWFWYGWVCAAFLREYLRAGSDDRLLPDRERLAPLLEAYLLERAMYELGFELAERPEWVAIPLRAILELVEAGPDGAAPHNERSHAS